MQKPFDLELVDALIVSALRKAYGYDADDCSESPNRAETVAAGILIRPGDAWLPAHDGSVHLFAGFRRALRLCCRVLADPLHVHSSGVRRDVKSVYAWLDAWRNDARAEQSRPDPKG